MNTLVFTGGSIVLENALQPDGWLAVRGEEIAALGPPVMAPPAAQTIDLAGGYLVPGFVDLHVHGGGFVSGSADMSDPNSRSYAVEMNCVVVSVDYRLAPETPFPGPVEDCYAALLWVQGAAEKLGIDPTRIMIAGESAGAGLVAGLGQLTRDRGQVRPIFQYLAEPMLDHRSVDSDHPHTGHFGWTRDHNRFGWDSMLGSADTVSRYCSPAVADDLSGLPPTFIHIGAIDLFLEESLDYARRLTRAGVSVELHVWPGAFHAFGSTDCHISREARRVARTAIKRALWGSDG